MITTKRLAVVAALCGALFPGLSRLAAEEGTALEEQVPTPDGAPMPAGKGDDKGKGSELGGVPAVFRTPETGLGGGAVLIYIPERSGDKVSSVLAGLLFTQKEQFLTAVYTEQYFAEDRWAAEVYLAAQSYPDSFFGVGADTRAEDEEFYTWRQRKAAVSVRRLLTPHLRVGVNLAAQGDRFTGLKEGGLLESGGIHGVDGGDARAIGASVRWDSFDDGYSPTKGEVVNLLALRYDDALGSDYEQDLYELNLKKFWSLSPDDVIGAQLYGQINTGDVPFYQLAFLGGKNMLRGYFLGRYRDRNMLVAQTEYRRRLWGRFGGVVFAGVGDVAHDVEGFTARDMKSSGGFGLRYQLVDQQRINVRLDFGFGRGQDNPSVYLYILEAF